MGRGERGGGGIMPEWLGRLVEESFFVGCGVHESRKKNEKNIFCLHCCASVCSHCAPSHSSHPLLQVRRYVYNDVVRLDDLERLIDCSYVQPYTINRAKVVFLKPRPQSRPFKGSGNICLTCDRILQEPYHFCSLSCKMDHAASQGEGLSSIMFRFAGPDFAFPRFEDLEMDSSDLLDRSSSGIAVSRAVPVQRERSGGGSEAPKKKRSEGGRGGGGGGFFPQIVLSLSSRRKGAPHRAPLS